MSSRVDPVTGELTEYRVECPACEEHLRERREAEAKLMAVQDEMTRLLRENKRLRAELAKETFEGPFSAPAKELGKYWIERSGRNPKRTKIAEKRLKLLENQLRLGHTPMYIARAIDGIVEYGWVDDKGTKHDDLTTLCSDTSRVERYHDMAERMNAPTLINRHWLLVFGNEDDKREYEDRNDVPL